jgi:NAD(P)H-hydrate repair Nnr-like enzyme with NAD(P)H-hydrate epimerase domain
MAMKLVTVQEMKQIESAGLGYGEMMDRAGKAVAEEILRRVGPGNAGILVLVGPGNNGGDGLVAARALCGEGCDVTAYLWRRERD